LQWWNRRGPRGRGGLARLVDESWSARLGVDAELVDEALLRGEIVDEGEGRLAELAREVVERARGLGEGMVLAVLYAAGVEARVAAEAGGRRLAIAVAGRKSVYGHEALSAFGDLRGRYQIVLVEPV